MQVSQMREEQIQTAGFLACQGMLHNYLAAARDDQFLVEQDLHEAAAPGNGPLRNRDHNVPENSVAVGHRVTEFVPEPRICPLAAIKDCPETATSVTERDRP
jgi:hypothetical protein